MPRTQQGSKNWCFTINNPEHNDDKHIEDAITDAKQTTPTLVRYIILQRERGESGTLHIQGYIQLCRRTRLNRIKSLLGGRANCQIRGGNHQEARAYCTPEGVDGEGKEGVVAGSQREEGHPIEAAGQRTDNEALHRDLQSGERPLADLADQHFSLFVRYHRGIEKFVALQSKSRDFPCNAEIHYGVPGAGKSYAVHTAYPDAYWVPGGERLWFDGYTGQDTIVFDDFDGKQCSFNMFKRLCDPYPLRLPTKGGFVQCLARRVVFTSNTPYSVWFPGSSHDAAALRRRIGSITHYPFPYARQHVDVQ